MTQANNETQAALIRHDRLLSVADIAGTFLFAIEGATAAVTGDLDLLGLMVLAFSTALAGGITRDLLIGAVQHLFFVHYSHNHDHMNLQTHCLFREDYTRSALLNLHLHPDILYC